VTAAVRPRRPVAAVGVLLVVVKGAAIIIIVEIVGDLLFLLLDGGDGIGGAAALEERAERGTSAVGLYPLKTAVTKVRTTDRAAAAAPRALVLPKTIGRPVTAARHAAAGRTDRPARALRVKGASFRASFGRRQGEALVISCGARGATRGRVERRTSRARLCRRVVVVATTAIIYVMHAVEVSEVGDAVVFAGLGDLRRLVDDGRGHAARVVRGRQVVVVLRGRREVGGAGATARSSSSSSRCATTITIIHAVNFGR